MALGLETVGSINFENKVKNISENKNVTIQKGEKLGQFAYSGSTVMLLFLKG